MRNIHMQGLAHREFIFQKMKFKGDELRGLRNPLISNNEFT